MKILGLNITRNQNSSRPARDATQKSFDSAAWFAGEDLNSTYRAPCLNSPYEQVAWAYRAINAIGEQIANIPFVFTHGERGREHLITSGPLIDFYDQPHPHINRFQYWELRILWLMLRGECFRIPIYDQPLSSSSSISRSSSSSSGASPIANQNSKIKNESTQLKAVLILNPDNFQAIIKNHLLVGWRYTGFPHSTPLESQVFLPEEVWYDKLPNPFDFWRGLSPLSAASLALKTDFAASAFMHAFMDNNADNGLIIRTNEQLDDSQRQQVLSALRNRKGRAGSPDSPLLLWNNCEIVKPTLSAVDLQFLENRKFSRGEICAALGVPEEIVASTDHNKYDVMQGARLNYLENRTAPHCARHEASERATVRALDPNAIGWFDLDSLPIMQQARRDRLATAKLGFDMGIPFNELNSVLDLGFQPLANGNTGYLPTNLQPTATLTETKKLRPDSERATCRTSL
jgi:phage portal protein BeeE